MTQPGADVQPPMQLLLRVGFGRRQGGPLDAELHAGFLSRHLVGRRQTSQRRFQDEAKNLQTGRPNLVFELSFPATPPLLEDFGQLLQAGVMKVKDFVLALSARYHQLPACTSVVTEECQG